MAISIQITQEDIDNVATKLDEFAAVLNDRERAVLYAVFGMAGKEISEVIDQRGGTAPGTGAAAPLPLSAGFREAFARGVGTKFKIYETSVEAETVRVKGGVEEIGRRPPE